MKNHCLGMNEHPIARMETMLRQGECPAHFLQSGMGPSLIGAVYDRFMAK